MAMRACQLQYGSTNLPQCVTHYCSSYPLPPLFSPYLLFLERCIDVSLLRGFPSVITVTVLSGS